MASFEFKAADGFALQGRVYGEPAHCRSAVLIVPAMGVPQRFYADFAQWLVGQGHAVMSFDYRGMGESRPAQMKHSLRGLQADINTWAEQDTSAALAWLDAQVAKDTPIHWRGHSLGGQIFGMVPNRARVSRVVTIGVDASQEVLRSALAMGADRAIHVLCRARYWGWNRCHEPPSRTWKAQQRHCRPDAGRGGLRAGPAQRGPGDFDRNH